MANFSERSGAASGHTELNVNSREEDMITHGFSVRHWQMIESGRPITLFTLLRICEVFDIRPEIDAKSI